MVDSPADADNKEARSVANILDGVAERVPQDDQDSSPIVPIVLEEMVPLQQSLEWRVSQHYWQTRGLSPFKQEAVPYGANCSGWAPTAAAELLLENAKERSAERGPLFVLELAAGSGLFARQLLDTLQQICLEQKSDVYERLTYIVTDLSPTSVREWHALGMFDAHKGRVELVCCDANSPTTLTDVIGDTGLRERPTPQLTAAFVNYALDSLPSAVVKQGADGPEQLHIKTLWSPDAQDSVAPAADDLDELLKHYRGFEFESEFRSAGASDLPRIEEILAFGEKATPRLLNYGALQCLETCMSLLGPQGFVLVNDYGPVRVEDVESMSFVHRFGAATAAGLHFPFLEKIVSSLGGKMLAAEGDADRTIHSRLISRADLLTTESAFERIFGSPAYVVADRVSARTNELASAGRSGDALDCCREGLRHYPNDWVVLGQAAELCSQRFAQHQDGLELTRQALAINPWTSAHLWNTHGNCLYALGRHDEALASYRRAEAIHPDSPQSQLNLAYCLAHNEQFAEALEAIAKGLANDSDSYFRSSLLEKQTEILARLAQRRGVEGGRASKRYGSYSEQD